MNLSPQTTSIILIVTLVLLVALLVIIVIMWRRLDRLLRGKNAATLEDSLVTIQKELDHLFKHANETDNTVSKIQQHARKSIRGINHKHFNAMDGMESGGHHSFVAAFVNDDGDGVLLTTLHFRDRINVLTKPISKWQADRNLLAEEQEVLTNAKNSHTVSK